MAVLQDSASVEALLGHIAEFAQSSRLLGTYAKNVALEDVSHSDMPWTAYSA